MTAIFCFIQNNMFFVVKITIIICRNCEKEDNAFYCKTITDSENKNACMQMRIAHRRTDIN